MSQWSYPPARPPIVLANVATLAALLAPASGCAMAERAVGKRLLDVAEEIREDPAELDRLAPLVEGMTPEQLRALAGVCEAARERLLELADAREAGR